MWFLIRRPKKPITIPANVIPNYTEALFECNYTWRLGQSNICNILFDLYTYDWVGAVAALSMSDNHLEHTRNKRINT